MLSGLGVSEQDVLALSALTQQAGYHELAVRLERAVDRGTYALALDEAEREMILRALDDPPTDGLAQLRGVILTDFDRKLG